MDETAFATLGQFLTSMTPQQKLKLSLGIAAEANKVKSRVHGKGIDLIVCRCCTKSSISFYIRSRQFTLVMDHKPLLTILGPKRGLPTLATTRLQRWALLLAAY